jgi:hypothetical protein
VADDPQQLRFHCAAQGGRVKQCKGAGCGPPACLCCAVLRATLCCLFFSQCGFVFAMPERELQPAILAASLIHSCNLYQHTLTQPVRRSHLPIVSHDALSYRNRSTQWKVASTRFPLVSYVVRWLQQCRQVPHRLLLPPVTAASALRGPWGCQHAPSAQHQAVRETASCLSPPPAALWQTPLRALLPTCLGPSGRSSSLAGC